MLNLDKLTGFAIHPEQRVSLSGTKYRIGQTGVIGVKLAMEILRRVERGWSIGPLRNAIREVRKTNCRAALACLAVSTPNYQLRLIAIWLRGQCGGYVGTQQLAKFALDEDETTRAKVAKALQRMSAWSVVESMSKNDPSERVRRLATQRRASQYKRRLKKFAENTSQLHVALTEQPLFLSKHVELTEPTPAKSPEFIRRLLEHIRSLVNGARMGTHGAP